MQSCDFFKEIGRSHRPPKGKSTRIFAAAFCIFYSFRKAFRKPISQFARMTAAELDELVRDLSEWCSEDDSAPGFRCIKWFSPSIGIFDAPACPAGATAPNRRHFAHGRAICRSSSRPYLSW
jgi:hypothetical protein